MAAATAASPSSLWMSAIRADASSTDVGIPASVLATALTSARVSLLRPSFGTTV